MTSDDPDIIVVLDNFVDGTATEVRISMPKDDDDLEVVYPPVVAAILERYKLTPVEEFYDPSQPRAKDGKWTSGSRGGQSKSADDPVIQATAESKALAASVYAKAVAAEPEITARIAGIIGDTKPETYSDPEGSGQLYGYKHRLKSEEAIATKIERVVEEKGYTRDEAADDIKDAVRYTVHYPDDSFGPQAQTLVDTLRAENPSVNVKNTWPPDLGSAYKGINVQVIRGDGVKFEVQIHTPRSQAVKDRMHVLYEEQRVLLRSSPRWQEIEREMLRMGNEMDSPTGAMEVFELLDDEPTQYFVARNSNGEVSAVARWYLPNSIVTEINTGDGWVELDVLLDLHEDTGWEPVDGVPDNFS